jgi:hypothetical protein
MKAQVRFGQTRGESFVKKFLHKNSMSTIDRGDVMT